MRYLQRKPFAVSVAPRGDHPKKADLRDVFAPKCPLCGESPMFEHDTGYDECGHCDFFVIYYPETWSTNDEYRMILERQAATWRERCNDLGGPGFPGEEQASPHSLKRTWPPSDKQLDAVAQLLGADPGGWTKTIRASGLLEHVCEHGVGHPDPASAATLGDGYSIHGCDGCCGRDDFPGKRQA